MLSGSSPKHTASHATRISYGNHLRRRPVLVRSIPSAPSDKGRPKWLQSRRLPRTVQHCSRSVIDQLDDKRLADTVVGRTFVNLAQIKTHVSNPVVVRFHGPHFGSSMDRRLNPFRYRRLRPALVVERPANHADGLSGQPKKAQVQTTYPFHAAMAPSPLLDI